ncbi:MAG: RCC1 domain-containing protein [Planctomycetota bacterium]|jgi:hypothetical protein
METKRISAILVLALGVVLCAGRGALARGGEVVAWGSNGYGQCDVPDPNESFIAVAGGAGHSLGLKADGSIVPWGSNYHGQCNVPLPNEGFIAVAAGTNHSLGLKADGSVAAWGDNYAGKCDVPEPNEGFVAVAAGTYHSLGLKADGSVVAWGDNSLGQCDVPLPNEGFVVVAAGDYHSLGLKADGFIVAWGDNGYGQCDVPDPNEGFVAVAAGISHNLGLKADGSIVAWGWNDSLQCDVPEPNEGFIAVAAGYYHSLGLKADGSIVAWGWNADGQCEVPEPNEGFTAVAAGYYHSLGLKAQPMMGTAFTYQGRLIDANSAADGPYDLEFRLYDSGGVQQANTVKAENLNLIDGYFTVELDFGTDVFNGLARWLQIGVRPGDQNDPCEYTALAPRQQLTPTPYAVYAESAGNDNDWMLSGNDMYSMASGSVGIGTTNPQGVLDVNGPIYQRGGELHSDYVFEPGYELESIEEHSRYMWENKHLKAIPERRLDDSGQEIIEVGAHRKGIVEELEKAHIYIEQLHKRIGELQDQKAQMEGRMAKLEAIIGELAEGREGEGQ